MDLKKLEEILEKLGRSRKDLWDVEFDELYAIQNQAKDMLDEISLIELKLENGIDKYDELMMEFEDEDEWVEYPEENEE
jgi:hypothetical protein